MAVKDFRAIRIRTGKIIGSSSSGDGNPWMQFYSASAASNYTGGTNDANMLSSVGRDVGFFVSGAVDSKFVQGTRGGTTGGVTLFGGDVVVSGTLYADKQVIEIDESVTGSLSVSGSLFVSASLEVGGGADINISQGDTHPAQTFNVRSQVGNALSIFGSTAPDGVYINSTGADIDFIVKNDAGGYNIVSDASTNQTMVGGTMVASDIDAELEVRQETGDATILITADGISSASLAFRKEIGSTPGAAITLTPAENLVIVNSGSNKDIEVKLNSGGTLYSGMTFDAQNKRVGVGTASPASFMELQVADAGDADGLFIDFNETGNYHALKIDSEAAFPTIQVSGKKAGEFIQDISNGYGLDVSRNINEAGSNPLVTIKDSSTYNQQTTLELRQHGSGDILNLFDGNTEVLTVTDGGKVGIGQSTPLILLEVEGSSSPQAKFTNNADTFGGGVIRLQNSRAGNAGVNNDFAGGVEFYAPNSAAAEKLFAKISGKVLQADVNKEIGSLTFEVISNVLTNKGTPLFIRPDRIHILSGGADTSHNEASGLDVAFYVSGSTSSKDTATRGTAVFGGDLVVSGTIYGTVSTTETVGWFAPAAASITTTGSLGVGTNAAGSLYTTAQIVLKEDGNAVFNEAGVPVADFRVETNNLQGAVLVDGGTNQILFGTNVLAASAENGIAPDIQLLVSGGKNSKDGVVPGVAAFMGDVVVSGTLWGGVHVSNMSPALQIGGDAHILGSGVQYLNFGTTAFALGYGIRSDSGTLQFKNISGTWENFGATAGETVGWFSPGATSITTTGSVGIGTANPADVYTTAQIILKEDGNAIFNEAGVASADFRVETNNLQGALLIDGGTNHVIIGSNATTALGAGIGTDMTVYISGNMLSKDGSSGGVAAFAGDVVVSGGFYIGGRIFNEGNVNTYIRPRQDEWEIYAGGSQMASFNKTENTVSFNPDQEAINTVINGANKLGIGVHGSKDAVLILSGGSPFSVNEAEGLDVAFYVSGSQGSKSTANRGTAVFGGDVVVSGSFRSKQLYTTTHKYTPGNNGRNYLRFDTIGSDASPGINNKLIAPYAGRLTKILVRCDVAAGVTVCGLHIASNGTI